MQRRGMYEPERTDYAQILTLSRFIFQASCRFIEFACSFILGDLPPSVRHVNVVFNLQLPNFRNPAFDPVLHSIAEAVKACEALETIEFVGSMSETREDGWTFATCRDLLKSRIFTQNSYNVNVVETPSPWIGV